MSQTNTRGKSFFGLILILFGGLILLENLNLISGDMSRILFSFPAFLIVIGIIILINSDRKGFGTVVLLIGSLFMLERIVPSFDIDFGVIFALTLIFAGAYVIFRHRKIDVELKSRFFKRHDNLINDDMLDEIAIFGGGEKKFANQNFKGGRITTVFGGNEIDLTECKLAPGTNVIDVFTMFGGVELQVPSSWKVKQDVIPIFGGFSQSGRKAALENMDESATLFVKGIVIFGGVEVKSV